MSQKMCDLQLLDGLASTSKCPNIDCELKTQPNQMFYSLVARFQYFSMFRGFEWFLEVAWVEKPLETDLLNY